MLEDVAKFVLLLWFIVAMPALILVVAFSEFATDLRKRLGVWPRAKLIGQCALGASVAVIWLFFILDRWEQERAFAAECGEQHGPNYIRIHPEGTSGLVEYCREKLDGERWPF